jgi:hypothetical protein
VWQKIRVILLSSVVTLISISIGFVCEGYHCVVFTPFNVVVMWEQPLCGMSLVDNVSHCTNSFCVTIISFSLTLSSWVSPVFSEFWGVVFVVIYESGAKSE